MSDTCTKSDKIYMIVSTALISSFLTAILCFLIVHLKKKLSRNEHQVYINPGYVKNQNSPEEQSMNGNRMSKQIEAVSEESIEFSEIKPKPTFSKSGQIKVTMEDIEKFKQIRETQKSKRETSTENSKKEAKNAVVNIPLEKIEETPKEATKSIAEEEKPTDIEVPKEKELTRKFSVTSVNEKSIDMKPAEPKTMELKSEKPIDIKPTESKTVELKSGKLEQTEVVEITEESQELSNLDDLDSILKDLENFKVDMQ